MAGLQGGAGKAAQEDTVMAERSSLSDIESRLSKLEYDLDLREKRQAKMERWMQGGALAVFASMLTIAAKKWGLL